MLLPEQLDRIHIAFDDHSLVANAGLLLPVGHPGPHLSLGELVDVYVDLGCAPGRTNAGDKMLTLMASALARGDCIAAADVLRTGGTERCWGVRSKRRPPGDLPAEFQVAPRTSAGPGNSPLTIVLDFTLPEIYGLTKEGGYRYGYPDRSCYHPLMEAAAVTGDVMMAQLRVGRHKMAQGVAYFLQETVSCLRYAGAARSLKARVDSGFYTRAIVVDCRKMDARFSITFRIRSTLDGERVHGK